MNILSDTLLPRGKVTLAVVSGDCPYIDGVRLLTVPKNKNINSPISSHPDVNMCVAGDMAFVADEQTELAAQLKSAGFKVVSVNGLGNKYPYDSRLNVAVFGKTAILNPKTADRVLVEHLKSYGYTLLYTPQGYAKCSTLPVNSHAVITCDRTIERVVLSAGMDCLYVEPAGIKLDGYEYGFIGGCGGLISRDEMLVFGSLDRFHDGDKIYRFLTKYGVSVRTVGDELTDFGSFIPICERPIEKTL